MYTSPDVCQRQGDSVAVVYQGHDHPPAGAVQGHHLAPEPPPVLPPGHHHLPHLQLAQLGGGTTLQLVLHGTQVFLNNLGKEIF